MNYGKITTEKQIMVMPNPCHLSIANPTEEKKSLIAQLDNWLEMVYTEQPQYDPQTQYLVEEWEEENGKAVQHWTIHEKEPEPPTIEERVEDLEESVDTIIGNENA